MWLIVASAGGSLVYHIPESKSYLAAQLKKSAGSFGFPVLLYIRSKRKRPAVRPGVVREMVVWERAQTVDCATTTLRQGFSTNNASSEARMLAPAAMMNTLSQVPDDCCM